MSIIHPFLEAFAPRRQRRTSALASIATALLAAAWIASTAPASAQVRVEKAFGDWQVKCATPRGAKAERCMLVQEVTATDRPNVGLSVMFLKTNKGKDQTLRVLAPLGVLLPAGLGLKIDNSDIGRAPFVRCTKIGCIADVVVKDELVEKFTKGKQAVFIIFETPDSGIGIPISLKGFTTGMKSLD